MNINLDNYEQYLLMYVDNELSAADRMHVEAFLRDYPYLQEELEILQQTVLPLETVLFDKSSLLKPEIDEATQEKLLMHLDGELPAGESLALQNSLKSDAMMQKEWALLQKTKLDAADIIEYPAKESLYRKEKARVIAYVRWAVAAMLIGAGLFVAVKLVSNDNDKSGKVEMVTNDPNGKDKKEAGVTDNKEVVADPSTTNDQQLVNNEDQKEEKLPVVKEETQPVKNNMLAVKEQKKNKANDDVVMPDQKSNPSPDIAGNEQQPSNRSTIAQPKELPQRNTENVLKNNNDIAIEKIKNENDIDLPTNINTSKKPIVDKLLTETTNSYARTASLGFDENNQDQILMMEEENVSRSKAAILLKKLKRNVERRANIKPGKSLRIAGFEFAVK